MVRCMARGMKLVSAMGMVVGGVRGAKEAPEVDRCLWAWAWVSEGRVMDVERVVGGWRAPNRMPFERVGS